MENILHDIEFTSADKTISSRQSRAIKKGQLRRIAPRILTSNFDDPEEAIIKRNIWLIIAHQFPDVMVSHRSALEYSPTAEGDLFLTAKHSRNLELPGITLQASRSPPVRIVICAIDGSLTGAGSACCPAPRSAIYTVSVCAASCGSTSDTDEGPSSSNGLDRNAV